MSVGGRIAGSTAALSLSNACVRLLALLSMPLLTRLLAPEAYGVAALVGTIVSLAAMIGVAGVDMSYARAYRARHLPSGPMLEAFVWRFAIGFGLLVATLTAAAWWLAFAEAFQLPNYIAVLVFCGVLFSLLNTMSLTRARLNNRYGLMSLALVVSAVISVAISVGVAFWWNRTELPLILSMLAGYIVPVLILRGPPLRGLTRSSGLSRRDRLSVLMIGSAGVLTAPLYWVLSSLDRWFLGYFNGPATVGVYSVGYSVAIVGLVVNSAVLAIWLPEAAKAYEEDHLRAQGQLGFLAERLVLALGVVWLAVTASGGDIIRLLAGEPFKGAAQIVPYIAGAVFFNGVIHVFNASVLLKQRLPLTLWWWGGAGVLCVVLNMALVPSMGGMGAAIVQALTFAVVALGVGWTGQRLFPLKMRALRLLAVLGAMLLIGILMASAWADAPLDSLLLKAPVGLLAAVIALWVMAPEVFGILMRHLLFSRILGR